MRCVLREVRDEDLPLLFEQWTDPIAGRMAAFTTPDQADWDAFERRWSRLRADESVINRAIVVDGEVTGTIGSWGDPGEREVTYWIGRSHWGKGIATGALSAFLAVDLSRPLHARVAYDNVASRRVLEKCGFRFVATERGFAQARSAEIEEGATARVVSPEGPATAGLPSTLLAATTLKGHSGTLAQSSIASWYGTPWTPRGSSWDVVRSLDQSVCQTKESSCQESSSPMPSKTSTAGYRERPAALQPSNRGQAAT